MAMSVLFSCGFQSSFAYVVSESAYVAEHTNDESHWYVDAGERRARISNGSWIFHKFLSETDMHRELYFYRSDFRNIDRACLRELVYTQTHILKKKMYTLKNATYFKKHKQTGLIHLHMLFQYFW